MKSMAGTTATPLNTGWRPSDTYSIKMCSKMLDRPQRHLQGGFEALGKESSMLSIRQVVQDYGRSCEHLLSSHSFDAPLSEEEMRFIQYYMNEMGKQFEDIIPTRSN
jgi:hypothetical protein